MDAAAILGVPQGCTDAHTLHQAYTKQSLRCHPDRGGTAEAQQQVAQAYELMKKQAYQDRWGTSSSAYGSSSTPQKQITN